MPVSRLPSTVSTVYAELLEQALIAERFAGLEGLSAGGLVEKAIRGRRYLYWQVRKGGRSVQRYLGPDTTDLRARLAAEAARVGVFAEERASLDRLAAMLLAAGVPRETREVAGVLRLFADAGLFRRGAVLVATQAFRAYAALLGVTFEGAAQRTQDIAISLAVAVAAGEEGPSGIAAELVGREFLPVPGLDPRQASTSFKLRGRELRVDFLLASAARRGGNATDVPVPVPGFGVSAWPLPFLDYLIEGALPAVVVAPAPALVRVPRPGRFALHKLWTAARRPTVEANKAREDRAQAEALLEVLLEDRPDDLVEAWEALGAAKKGRSPRALVERGLATLPEALRDRLRAVMGA